MYLLLVDHNFISSDDLQEMIEKAPEGTDIINCFSTNTLLKVSEQLTPDLVILDFAMVKEDLTSLFTELRKKAQGAHVIALIDPDYYDQLYEAIELGGIDDYMVKPISKEDFFARVQIATRKKQDYKESFQSQIFHGEEEESFTPDQGFTESETDQSEITEDSFAAWAEEAPEEETPEEEEDLFSIDEFDYEEHEDEKFAKNMEPETSTEGPDLFAEEYETEEDAPIEEEEVSKELDLDSDLELEPEPEFDDKTASEFGTEPSRVGEYNFDDIVPPEEHDYQETGFDQAESAESSDEGFDEKEMPSGEDFSSLFEEQPEGDEEVTNATDDHSNSFADITESGETEEVDFDFSAPEEKEAEKSPPEPPEFGEPDWEDDQLIGHDQESTSEQTEPGPEVLRPADEFVEGSRSEDETRFTTITPEEEDKGFEELFSDIPSIPESDPEKTRREKDTAKQDEAEIFEDPELADLGPGTSEEEKRQIEENYRKSLRSELPGDSADEFLFGDEDNETKEQDEQGYNQEMLDQFTEESDESKDEEKDPKKRSRANGKKGSKGKFSRFFTIIGNLVFVFLLLVMAALSFFLIQSRITGGVPEVAGYQMYIVLSGSMNPEFDTGSLAFVRETDPDKLETGDIITFRGVANPDSLTTHRIVEVMNGEELKFITRGDANNVNDPNPVPAENVVGKVAGAVPYVGYLMNFVQTSQGLILLIFVPGVLIIVFELGKIMKYLTQGEGGKRNSQAGGNNMPTEGNK